MVYVSFHSIAGGETKIYPDTAGRPDPFITIIPYSSSKQVIQIG